MSDAGIAYWIVSMRTVVQHPAHQDIVDASIRYPEETSSDFFIGC